ncbi:MAG: hypothetical protein GX640_02720 [Fibrobacter sp.]|nr:hypothetical protein [Fibrobacter sp.]
MKAIYECNEVFDVKLYVSITHHNLHSDIVGDDYKIIVRLTPEYGEEPARPLSGPFSA